MKRKMRQFIRGKEFIFLAVLVFLIVGCVSQVKTADVKTSDVKTKYDDLATGISGIKVQNTKGEEVDLESLWSNRRVALVFLRHFGCMFCRQQAAAFMEVKDQLDKAGVTLVAIGSGTPKQAQDFANKFKFEGELYVNQDLSAYKAFHLERGFWRTLGPRSLWTGMKTMTKGYFQGLNAGDLWQQGGVFVMGPGKQVIFEHRNEHAGDHVDMQKVIEAISSGKNEAVVAPKVEEPVAPKEAVVTPKVEESVVAKEAVVAPKIEEPVVPKETVAAAAAAPTVTDKILDPISTETKSIPEQDIRNFVSKWLASWQSGDMETYRSCYAQDFHSKGKNLNSWITYKTNVHKKSKNINISIDNLQISIKANNAAAVFTESYSSSVLKDKGKKTLKLKKISDEWKIIREIM